MSERFVWVPDVARGEWLRRVEVEKLGSVLSVVPAGFEAYARVFHPVERDRPRDGRTWRGVDETTYFSRVQNIEESLERERTTWATAAASFGTTMHAEAQYDRLVRCGHGESDGAIAADGWRYSAPHEGCLDTDTLAATSAVLVRHTSTPAAGTAAVWEGWGGLVSSAGVARFEMVFSEDLPFARRLAAAVRRGFAEARSRTRIRAVPRFFPGEPEPGSGLLPREVAAGPRLDLHGGAGRSYVLFEAGAGDFAHTGWPDRAPWVDEAWPAQSPSIVWPEDHAWVLATEIDFDSTLVAGTRALIHELVRTPGVEALPIGAEADLTLEGDVRNRLG